MAKKNTSTRYFQLTNDILLEYTYNYQTIDLGGKNKILTVTPELESYNYFCMQDVKQNVTNIKPDNILLPTNSSFTKFVKLYYKDNPYALANIKDDYDLKEHYSINLPQENPDLGLPSNRVITKVDFDRIKIHFTGGNYFGDYESLLIDAFIYGTNNHKTSLASFLIQRTDNVKLNNNPMLLNQKLYTTYLEYFIPSITSISSELNILNYENVLFGKDNKTIQNTPLSVNIYGVKQSYFNYSFNYFNVEKLNNIIIPNSDLFANIYIDIKEATDGDYFVINTKVSNFDTLSAYINSITDTPEAYIILHELTLKEFYTDMYNKVHSVETHKEHYMVNAASYNEDEKLEINEGAIDNSMYYRPICLTSDRCVRFEIKDVMKLINTKDNTTVVKEGTLMYNKPAKYGKQMLKLHLGELPAQVNVFNKRSDENIDTINIVGGSHGATIENHQYTIGVLIESSDIKATVEPLQVRDVVTTLEDY